MSSALRGLIFYLLGTFSAIAHAAPTLINGAGSTFAAPLYSKWAAEYRQVDPDVEINYQSIGSGGGIRQFIAGTIDFGATDDPMKDEEIKQAKGVVYHVPTAIGGVVITYNIPGLLLREGEHLRLTGEVLADIFLGRISKWDDAKIKALNPNLKLPPQFIVVATRADGSGTTAVFTEYLASAHKEWKSVVGKGKSVKFPTGLAGKGNEGVTGLVRQNPGAIGYVELTFAIVNKLSIAAIKNPTGEFIFPTLESLTAAATTKGIGQNLQVSLLNSSVKGAYPLAALTYLLINKNMSAEKAVKFQGFLNWAMTKGQEIAPSLHYAPLPDALLKKVKPVLTSLTSP